MVITLGHVFDSGYKHLIHVMHLVYYCVCFIMIIFSFLGIYFKKPGIREMQAVMKREKKSAATIGLIQLVLLLMSLPALLLHIVLTVKGIENFGPYRPFMFLLFTVDAFVNPFLSFGRSNDMYRALKGLFRCCQHVQQQQQQRQQH